jgi:mxaA protein
MRADRRVWAAALYAVFLLGPRPACAESVILNFQVANLRPFGYVIGDTIERRIELEAARPFALESGKLPKPGRVNTWLDLQKVKLASDVGLHSTRYQLTLTYQLINSPEALETLALPKVSLRFVHGSKAVVQEVPEFLFNAAPITPPQVLAREGLDVMRPDQPPPPIPETEHRILFTFFLSVSMLTLLYMGYLRFGLPWQGPRPFAWAYRDLRRLAKQADGEHAFREGLRRVHRAFNQTAGRPLFAEQLEAFFAEHPRFAQMQSTTQKFFELSRSEFFGIGAGERPMNWLLTFCRDWRTVEAE